MGDVRFRFDANLSFLFMDFLWGVWYGCGWDVWVGWVRERRRKEASNERRIIGRIRGYLVSPASASQRQSYPLKIVTNTTRPSLSLLNPSIARTHTARRRRNPEFPSPPTTEREEEEEEALSPSLSPSLSLLSLSAALACLPVWLCCAAASASSAASARCYFFLLLLPAAAAAAAATFLCAGFLPASVCLSV